MGSTKLRTQLYHKIIKDNYAALTIKFTIFGIIDNDIEILDVSKSYSEFLIFCKNENDTK